ncbi:MAG: FxsA family protein [Alphaproteobacteria bacterium]|nr:FxsA family protein [Alphaproteobacteria bacterium]
MVTLLFIIFIITPLLEIAILLYVGEIIGLFPTLFIIIATAAAGTFLLRLQGLAILFRLKQSIDRLEPPLKEVFDGACLLIAGLTLLTPGFVTDSIGFLLFIPKVREYLRIFLTKRLNISNIDSFHYSNTPHESSEFSNSKIIDVEYKDIDENINNDKNTD